MELMHVQEQENPTDSLDKNPTNCDPGDDRKYSKSNTESSEENSVVRSEGTTTKTDAQPSNIDQGTITCLSTEPLDNSSYICNENCDLKDDNTQPEETSLEDKENKMNCDGKEEEGTYEELICLVRQFYVEKPINPAALAHQNIETC